MRDRLRVALTVDPYIPVPPRLYGGIERVVDFLVRGLAARGHRLTLFAHPASRVPADLVPYGVPPHDGRWSRTVELWQVGARLWRDRTEWDVVHSFGRLAALLPVLPRRSLPKIQSYQRDQVPWAGVRRARRLAGRSLVFTGCSASVYRARPSQDRRGGEWRTIFNGVDPGRYRFVPAVPGDAPLVFLGRLEAIKGVHHAIAIAKIAGRRLVIAGNRIAVGPGTEYFRREVAPHVDGSQVRYVGPVDDGDKNALLGSAAALLMPVEWEEPFGIVMAEAFACGTPVIGFPRGALPEVVRHGVNGFLCGTVAEAAAAVHRLDDLDRSAVRRDCEARFADRVIVDAYERLYRELVGC
jgi:glycosyltransferase involved in cell wall biosynthesis